jgi:hypothetical protein
MHDAADDSAIVRPLDAPDMRRQVRFDHFYCSSLSQNRFLRTNPIPFQKRIRTVLSERKRLMSSDPSHDHPKAEMRYSAFMTKILLPRVVLGHN